MNPLDAVEIGKALEDVAAILAEYREALMARGFTRDEALTLVASYQMALFTPGRAAE